MRFSTTQRSTKNHPIYLFKYLHGIRYSSGTPSDTLGAAWLTAMNEWGDDLVAGISDGTNTRILCSPRGAVAQARTTLTTIRHRDFPT
jgi:broad specificity polyphosphatase/5'/3'-nucleotidase SurE